MKFKREQLPNLYVGSKSNCSIVDGKIVGSRGLYEGSCKSKMFLEARSTNKYEIFVLAEFDKYSDAIQYERNYQIENDVVASPNYFNASVACSPMFSNPDWAAYKNILTGQIARLPRIHPAVLDGSWVGLTYGTKHTPERRLKIKNDTTGVNNPFYGKKHSAESLARMKGMKRSQETCKKLSELAKNRIVTTETGRKISKANKGRVFSDEHRKNLSIASARRKMHKEF